MSKLDANTVLPQHMQKMYKNLYFVYTRYNFVCKCLTLINSLSELLKNNVYYPRYVNTHSLYAVIKNLHLKCPMNLVQKFTQSSRGYNCKMAVICMTNNVSLTNAHLEDSFGVPGNMWGQSWKNILDIVIPYPGKRRVDVTAEMLRQGYTPIRSVLRFTRLLNLI